MAERFTLYPVFQKISKWGGVSIFAGNTAAKLKKKLSLLVLVVLIVLYPIIIVVRNLKTSDLVLSLYILCFVVLATSSVFCNICINFSQTENVRKLFKCFAVLDFYLKKLVGGNILEEDVRFYIFWIVSLFTLLGSMCIDISHRILRYKSIILIKLLILNLTGHYLTYLLTLTVLQFTCIVFTIQTVLKLLNGHLHKVCKTEVLRIRRREKLKCLMKCYDKVFEMTTLCNKIFGVPILVVYPYLLVYFVRVVTFIIKFRILGEFAFGTLNTLLFFSDFLGCLLCMTITILITSVCAQTKQEIREASLSIFKIIVNIGHGERYKDLEEDLVTLSHSLMTRPYGFSASGFFEVDYTLLFALVGSISYYVVILIQFS